MRCVILGVSGLTGRAIARELVDAGWDVTGTGRDTAHFPAELARAGVRFALSDRRDRSQLATVLSEGADAVVDCVAYTAAQAGDLLDISSGIGSIVALSSKAVYVDCHGRHSNSEDAPDFGGLVSETCAVLQPDFSGQYQSRDGYGTNKVAMEQTLLAGAVPVSILRPSRIHGVGAQRLREWFIVKRILDGRARLPLAHGGKTGNHPTAAVNLAGVFPRHSGIRSARLPTRRRLRNDGQARRCRVASIGRRGRRSPHQRPLLRRALQLHHRRPSSG